MSEPIPESIPTSQDPRSRRPLKKARPTNFNPLKGNAAQHQSNAVEALFANPDREIHIPASTGPVSKSFAAPPEIVTNVQGSSAGAGSGEFHVYKASRRREYERLKAMDEEKDKEEGDKEFEKRREEIRKRDEEKRARNRAKRDKRKGRAKVDGKGPSVDVTAGRLPIKEDETQQENAQVAEDTVGIVIHDE